jgi:hypothetical protein
MEKFAANAERVYQIAVDKIFNAKDPITKRRRVTSVPFLKTVMDEYASSSSICSEDTSLSSEPPTKTYDAALSSESLKKTAFHPNQYRAPRPRPNICIVGAGPTGLYMAILLKHLMPRLDIVVVEKRATEEGHRYLTRDKELYIPSAFISRTQLFPSQPDPAADVDIIESVLSRICAPLASLLHVEGGLHLLAFIPQHTNQYIRINRLEHELAKAAQAKGVRVYHDNTITDLASIESRYTNEFTRLIFDATGGRLIPVDFPLVDTYKPSMAVPEKKLNAEYRTERSIPVYEGYLNPGTAIRKLAKSLYVPIGDTFMKVDFRGASPGTVNGMVLCVGLALATADAFPSSTRRSTRKSSSKLRTRRTRSAPF